MAGSLASRIRGGCLTAGSLGTIMAGVAVINADSRRYLVDALNGQFPPVLANLPFQHFAHTMIDTIPLGASGMALAASACVLFFLMLRT